MWVFQALDISRRQLEFPNNSAVVQVITDDEYEYEAEYLSHAYSTCLQVSRAWFCL